MERKKRIGYLMLALAFTLACVPGLPAVELLPTQPVGAVETMIAGTYAAASTGTMVVIMENTATLTPQPTGTITQTPTVTATATATIIFKTPTPLPITLSVGGSGGSGGGGGSGGSGGGGGGGGGTPPAKTYACKIIKTTPAYGSKMGRDKNFKTTWRITNTGNVLWDRNSVDYLFFDGTPLQTQSLYDLPITVAPNHQVDITVSMKSPKKAGTYETRWVLRIGDELFCTMEQKIVVN
jgi:hypothetical protein